jgi:hypothetical protein
MVDTESPLAPVRIVLQDDDFWGGTRSLVFCPVCHGENVHVGTVKDSSYDGETRVVISFWGDCGHRFEFVLLTRKGNTYAHIENVTEDTPVNLTWT